MNHVPSTARYLCIMLSKTGTWQSYRNEVHMYRLVEMNPSVSRYVYVYINYYDHAFHSIAHLQKLHHQLKCFI